LRVTLREDTETLDEVVVVGYGTMKKSDLTGAVAQVQSESLLKAAAPRIDQALTGLIAGVQVISTTGQPGEAPNIRVRGVGSISAGTGPLYVVDGFPEADIQMLNPSDIETIDILKDASATAIYGSRGANGVVIITTKRGKEGKASVNLDVYYGWQKLLKQPEYLTMEEQAQYYYDGMMNQNLDEGRNISGAPTSWHYPVPQTVMKVLDGSINQSYDANDYIFQTAPQQSYSLSVQGGNENIKYAVSGSYTSQDGIIVMSDFQRYTIRANIDAKLNNRVSMKFNINSNYSTSLNIRSYGGSGDAEGILGAATTWQYWYPLYNEDGSYYSGYGQDATNNVWNPLAQAYEIKRKNERYRTIGNLDTDILITDDLHLKVMLGATTSNYHSYYFIPKLDVFNNTAEGNDERSNSLNWITETTLNYQKTFKNHNINAMAGYTTQQNLGNLNSVMSRNYPNNLIHTLNAVGNNVNQGTSEESQWSMLSYLARINYNYKSRYYITGSIRMDGSSRFGRDNKYGYFPSAALAWRVSEESFMKDISQISDLKLRASYGSTGNNNIGNYAHLATVNYPSYVLGGRPIGGMAPNNIENTLLTWEKQNSVNFGFDASLFNSRVNLTAEYFITNNNQLLLNVNVPQITGFNTSLQNIGEVQNKGWEITLNTQNLTNALKWSTNFNISAFRNKVLKLGPEGAPLISTNHITQIGQPMGMFYGYQVDGIFKNQAELDAGPLYAPGTPDESRLGDIRFKDVSGPNGVPDGVITTADRTIIGNPYPKFYYGMTNTFSWKNFLLSFSLTGSYGNQVFNGNDMQMYTRARYKQYRMVYNYWKSETDPGDGNTPRPNNLPKGGLREKSSRYIDTGSFLKINNINFSYTFPKKIVQSLTLSDLRVYVTATNPFIFTKYIDYNPEVYNSTDPRYPGQMNYNYPIAKSLLIGFNVSF
jgi:TonB-linked SusC/RagA family outer membrane protein